MEETILVNTKSIECQNSKEIIKSVCEDLEEKGYNALKKVTEYLLTGEVGYISSYKECRNRISKLSRRDIVEFMLEEFIKWEFLEWIMGVKL